MAQTFKSLINIYQPSLNGLDIQTLNLTNIYISPVSMAQTLYANGTGILFIFNILYMYIAV